MKFATKRAYENTHITLGIVTALPWEIKNQFCRYSADVKENANKF